MGDGHCDSYMNLKECRFDLGKDYSTGDYWLVKEYTPNFEKKPNENIFVFLP